MEAISQFIGFFFMILPVLIIAFALRWLRLLYKNSEKITKQNEELIQLLKEKSES
ncbi:hypothetical protein [Piscibacillus salipiscarius]|uniref:DUF4083 domain-containing protein n=1 Tax=Piscibacillus salipiscarius TaxID=299480 RepID=A0ABW5QD72_9BACI|nr:hypothetical protein [Piscibacillus salipiscarius]